MKRSNRFLCLALGLVLVANGCFAHRYLNHEAPMEQRVAVEYCRGWRDAEVADRLNITLTTAISHRKNIMEKLHARSLADIIVYVVMNGLADVSEL